jgi:hypothetical protein
VFVHEFDERYNIFMSNNEHFQPITTECFNVSKIQQVISDKRNEIADAPVEEMTDLLREIKALEEQLADAEANAEKTSLGARETERREEIASRLDNYISQYREALREEGSEVEALVAEIKNIEFLKKPFEEDFNFSSPELPAAVLRAFVYGQKDDHNWTRALKLELKRRSDKVSEENNDPTFPHSTNTDAYMRDWEESLREISNSVYALARKYGLEDALDGYNIEDYLEYSS